MLHTHFHLRVALARRTNGLTWEPPKKQCCLVNRPALDTKVLSLPSAPVRYHSTSTPYSCLSRCSLYRKDKRATRKFKKESSFGRSLGRKVCWLGFILCHQSSDTTYRNVWISSWQQSCWVGSKSCTCTQCAGSVPCWLHSQQSGSQLQPFRRIARHPSLTLIINAVGYQIIRRQACGWNTDLHTTNLKTK